MIVGKPDLGREVDNAEDLILMPQTNSEPSALTFSVDGQLIGELGERLVTRNHVALAELIKNAYDADSPSVQVNFKEAKDSTGKLRPSIVLVDRGSGMSFSEVRQHWMRIATANKLRNPVSDKYGRPKTGNKGIGRFSCQRLAHELVLETVRRGNGVLRKVTVYFRWDKFVPGSSLTEIPCEYKCSTVREGEEGTTLSLVHLRDEWTQRDFDTLRRSTVHLAYAQEVKRSGYKADPGFRIIIEADGFERGAGDLLEQVVDAGWGRMTGRVDHEGYLQLHLAGRYLGNGKKFKSTKEYTRFSGLVFDISYLIGHESYHLNRDRKTLTRQVLAGIREHCGVRVYFDSFRVFPYGEFGDDWLGLDKDYAVRKGSIDTAFVDVARSLGLSSRDVGLLRPRNENLLGRVFIEKNQNHGLQVKINREGFVDTQALQDLIAILRQSIDWMTVHYAYAKSEHDKRQSEEAEEQFKEALGSERNYTQNKDEETVETALRVLADYAISGASAAGNEKAKETASAAKKLIQVKTESTRNELAILRALASTAPLLFTFSHEVSALVGRLDTHASRLRTISAKIESGALRSEFISIGQDLIETRKNFQQLYSLFGLVSKSRLDRPKRHYARRVLEKLIDGTSFSTGVSGISVILACDEDIKTPKIQEAEFLSIVVNLFTNSIKSAMAKGGGRIRVQVRDTRSDFIIEILDTGVGLLQKYWQEVLKPFVSDPANQIYRRLESRLGDSVVASMGRGSGLGLSIVKGIVDSHSGNIEFFKKEGWSIGVRVSLPKES